MDRGREIDNAQNTNAVYIDKYGNGGKTSVKTSIHQEEKPFLLWVEWTGRTGACAKKRKEAI